jgi:hypothetical protein
MGSSTRGGGLGRTSPNRDRKLVAVNRRCGGRGRCGPRGSPLRRCPLCWHRIGLRRGCFLFSPATRLGLSLFSFGTGRFGYGPSTWRTWLCRDRLNIVLSSAGAPRLPCRLGFRLLGSSSRGRGGLRLWLVKLACFASGRGGWRRLNCLCSCFTSTRGRPAGGASWTGSAGLVVGVARVRERLVVSTGATGSVAVSVAFLRRMAFVGESARAAISCGHSDAANRASHKAQYGTFELLRAIAAAR